ncbi:unnamed protein product [Rotaria sp. Silwood2]|nr:unnamed protein product [Rotaria sp. Silwood2]
MEQTKPQRRTIIFDYWNVNKKLKLIEESKSSSRQSVTLIEDLSNEIFYEIFNHLYVYYVYKAFYNLNIRLQNLLTNSTLPLKINVSSISKSIFQSFMIPIGCCRNPNEIYQRIFRLPALKYCKISLKEYSDYYSLPISTNVTSPIEHLVVTH